MHKHIFQFSVSTCFQFFLKFIPSILELKQLILTYAISYISFKESLYDNIKLDKQFMGQQKSKINIVSQLPCHPKLSNSLVTVGKDQKLMTVSLAVPRDEFNKWKSQKMNYKSMIKNCRHLLWPPQSKFKSASYCGTSGFSEVTLPYCPVTLKDEIINRSKGNITFQQKQLWYLMYSLVSLAEQVHRYGETIGDIQHHNVFISEKGEIKVMSQYSLPAEVQNVEKSFQKSSLILLSPQQCQFLKNNKEKRPKISPICECFAIGLTLLSTSILRFGNQIYANHRNFQKDILKKYIRQFQEQTEYQQDFKFIVKGLCQQDPKKRLTSFEVQKCLQPFEGNIYRLTPFKIPVFPEGIIKKLKKNVKKSGSERIDVFETPKKQTPYKMFEKNDSSSKVSQNTQNTQAKPHYLSKKSLIKSIDNGQYQLKTYNSLVNELHDSSAGFKPIRQSKNSMFSYNPESQDFESNLANSRKNEHTNRLQESRNFQRMMPISLNYQRQLHGKNVGPYILRQRKFERTPFQKSNRTKYQEYTHMNLQFKVSQKETQKPSSALQSEFNGKNNRLDGSGLFMTFQKHQLKRQSFQKLSSIQEPEKTSFFPIQSDNDCNQNE